jgi:2-dehydropantoate 2-reductase
MKVCIYGAGAVGGHLAARLLANTEAQVSLVVRSGSVAPLRERGLTLRTEGRDITGRPHHVTDDPSTLPPQDLVVVTLKAPSQPAVASQIGGLLGQDGVALFAMNGLPWWWNHGLNDRGALDRVDPQGALWREIGGERALGAVVNSSNHVPEPGLIVHAGAKRWTVGEPDNSSSKRLRRVVDLLAAADLEAVESKDIRRDIWRKLMTNISGSPIAALTRLAGKDAVAVSALDDVAIKLIEEALIVSKAQGFDLTGEVSPEGIARPAKGRFPGKPSMLQDVEAGRALEVEAILGQVQSFARACNIATPTIDVVYPLLSGLDHALRLAR